MAIHLESVAFSFQDRLIFNNLDLTLDKGHTYVVLGKSGVGKSTLLSLLKGWQLPQSGHIDYGDSHPSESNWFSRLTSVSVADSLSSGRNASSNPKVPKTKEKS